MFDRKCSVKSCSPYPELNQLCGAEARAKETVGAANIKDNDNDGNGDGDGGSDRDEDDDKDGNADADADDDEDDDDISLRTAAEQSAMKATILKVAINLTNEGLMGAREARALNDMIKIQHPVVVAAFKVRMRHCWLVAPWMVAISFVHRSFEVAREIDSG